MSALWTSAAIAKAVAGTQSQAFSVSGVAFDSREVVEGDLFLALRGAETDGHRYIAQALEAGAAGILCEQAGDYPHVRVADSRLALDCLAIAARERCKGRIIAVTGSVGKTTVKESIFAALEQSCHQNRTGCTEQAQGDAARCPTGLVHRSLKSYNNHVGVPLSLARMSAWARYGIFEAGMNHAGELAVLTRLIRPHVALITAIAPAHKEFFDSEEDIAHAKAEILEGLEPDGIAVLPFDSPYFALLQAKARTVGAQIVSFGFGDGADVRVLDSRNVSATGSEKLGSESLVTAQVFGEILCFRTRQRGAHVVSNAMAMLATVHAVGGDLSAAALALADLADLAGRGARHRLPLGTSGDYLLIDESYNANPASMAATIRQLGEETAARRLAVLGSMKELGTDSAKYHRDLAAILAEAKVDIAILIGAEMQPLAEYLNDKANLTKPIACHYLSDLAQIEKLLQNLLQVDDVLLVKGSNSIGLSKLVDRLIGKLSLQPELETSRFSESSGEGR